LLAFLTLTACSDPVPPPSPTVLPTPVSFATATPEALLPPMIDCIWSGKGSAFVDENSNQQRDIGEAPLAGVRFHVDDPYNNLFDVAGEAISDEHGAATFGVGLPGCPKTEFEVYTEPLDGYELTTPARLRPLGSNGETFSFGFKRNR
jgi:hypothetical protein